MLQAQWGWRDGRARESLGLLRAQFFYPEIHVVSQLDLPRRLLFARGAVCQYVALSYLGLTIPGRVKRRVEAWLSNEQWQVGYVLGNDWEVRAADELDAREAWSYEEQLYLLREARYSEVWEED